MTIDEFKMELHKTFGDLSQIEKDYNEFRKYQEITIAMLHEFHRVCEKYRIHYQITFGSLLGAIRDHGQVPWDYDADVFVPYVEKEMLIDALNKDLGEDYYFYSPEVDPRCKHYTLRLSKKGYRSEALHLDVFWVIGLPDDNASYFQRRILELINIRFYKYINIKIESMGNLKTALKLFFYKIRFATISIMDNEREMHKICTMCDPFSSRNLYPIEKGFEYNFLPSEIWETILIDLPDGKLRIPSCYDKLLRQVYGNYLRIPTLSKRIKEFTYSYIRLRYFDNFR